MKATACILSVIGFCAVVSSTSDDDSSFKNNIEAIDALDLDTSIGIAPPETQEEVVPLPATAPVFKHIPRSSRGRFKNVEYWGNPEVFLPQLHFIDKSGGNYKTAGTYEMLDDSWKLRGGVQVPIDRRNDIAHFRASMFTIESSGGDECEPRLALFVRGREAPSWNLYTHEKITSLTSFFSYKLSRKNEGKVTDLSRLPEDTEVVLILPGKTCEYFLKSFERHDYYAYDRPAIKPIAKNFF